MYRVTAHNWVVFGDCYIFAGRENNPILLSHPLIEKGDETDK